jgi:hypothetical protein
VLHEILIVEGAQRRKFSNNVVITHKDGQACLLAGDSI